MNSNELKELSKHCKTLGIKNWGELQNLKEDRKSTRLNSSHS